MVKVKGIGGIFFRSLNKENINDWYRTHLGIPVTEDGCAVFKWRDSDDQNIEHMTVWSAFARDTDYFGNAKQQFMINYIVESLDQALAQLKAEGVKVDEHVEDSEFGRFGWVFDAEDNRIELWEPPKSCQDK